MISTQHVLEASRCSRLEEHMTLGYYYRSQCVQRNPIINL